MGEEQNPAAAEKANRMTEEKHAQKHAVPGYTYRDPRSAVCTCITIFLLLIGITALVLWLVYRPYKPRFAVVAAAVYDFNTTAPPLISTSLQFTILARNPNRRVSIYYDKLSAYVSYRDQTITSQLNLPPLYQEKHSTVVFYPVIGGAAVPISMELANGLSMDQTYGAVSLKVILLGSLRWKAGAIWTGHHVIYVSCDVMVGFRKGFVGQVPLLGSPGCTVDI